MTTITPVRQDAHRDLPILRTNLSRFGLTLSLPPALCALIIDIFDLLPDPAARSFPGEIELAARPGADFDRIPARLLRWLLTDPQYGAVNLSQRDDVQDAIERVVRAALMPMAQGYRMDEQAFQRALLIAQVAQLKTWHAYRDASGIDGLQPRIEWMLATAATDAMRPNLPAQLVGAVHSCAVARSASQQDLPPTSTAAELYLAIRDQLLELLIAEEPAAAVEAPRNRFDQVGKGDRVQWVDVESGKQTGKVIGIVNMPHEQPSAVVLVDHAMAGITWNVPLADLDRAEAA